jgi:hypothetical protein
MSDRLEQIKINRGNPGLATLEEYDWLISEVSRLRAENARMAADIVGYSNTLLESQIACEKAEAERDALKIKLEIAKKALKLIDIKERSHLYEACMDCDGDQCTHGATYDPILDIVDKTLQKIDDKYTNGKVK